MKNTILKGKIFFGLFLLILIGVVYAHGEYLNEKDDKYQKSWYGNMHEETEEIIESGTFEQLEELREEYNMPIMHWIDDKDDFEQAKEDYKESVQNTRRRFEGCHGW